MQQSERTYSSGYRFGFGGQEKDDEVKGDGNSYTAEYWQYDSRLGRRWNRDPVVKAWESPYAAFSNNPILYNDPNGDEDKPATGGETKKSDTPWWKFKDGKKEVQLKEVEVSAKGPSWWKKAGRSIASAYISVVSFFNDLGDNIKPVLYGIANAFASDNLMGAGARNAKEFGDKAYLARMGQNIGHELAALQGTAEVIVGGGGEVLGVALDITGGGSVAGVPVGVASAGLIAHGVALAGVATVNNIKDIIESANDNAHGNSSTNGSSASKNTPEIEVPSGFTETKEFGKPHGQKVYKKGNKYISKDTDAHNGGVWKVFEKVGGKLQRVGTADKDLNIFKK